MYVNKPEVWELCDYRNIKRKYITIIASKNGGDYEIFADKIKAHEFVEMMTDIVNILIYSDNEYIQGFYFICNDFDEDFAKVINIINECFYYDGTYTSRGAIVDYDHMKNILYLVNDSFKNIIYGGVHSGLTYITYAISIVIDNIRDSSILKRRVIDMDKFVSDVNHYQSIPDEFPRYDYYYPKYLWGTSKGDD